MIFDSIILILVVRCFRQRSAFFKDMLAGFVSDLGGNHDDRLSLDPALYLINTL